MAVSDRQFSGVGEAVCLSQVVGEFPELGLKEGVEYPDLVTLFFVEGADMRNVPLIDCCLKPVNTKKCFVSFFSSCECCILLLSRLVFFSLQRLP